MGKIAVVTTSKAASHERQVSELGRRLRKISGKIAISGEKPLTRREVQREIAQRRGGLSFYEEYFRLAEWTRDLAIPSALLDCEPSQDEVLRDAYATRDDYEAEHGYDLDRIYEDLRRREATSLLRKSA